MLGKLLTPLCGPPRLLILLLDGLLVYGLATPLFYCTMATTVSSFFSFSASRSIRFFIFSINLHMSSLTLSADLAVSCLLSYVFSSISVRSFFISCWSSITAFLFSMSLSTL